MMSYRLATESNTPRTRSAFSSVATNTRVGPGGAYFIISRSLGIEIGGAATYIEVATKSHINLFI